jgi:hypothetical protein
MQKIVSIVIIVAIFVPYRMSEWGQDSSFGQDLIVAVIAFAVAGGVGYLINANKNKGNSNQD